MSADVSPAIGPHPLHRRGALAIAATLFGGLQVASLSLAAAQPADKAESSQPKGGTTLPPTGNTILITGGGSGLGREFARRFSDQGNVVIVAGRRLPQLQETIADRKNMHAMELDVDDPAAIRAFATKVVAEHPKLNALFNIAGIMRIGEDLTKSRDLREAEAQVTTNLLGPIRLTNALIDHLKSTPNPVIVNVSSGLAFVPRADAATYSATKTAIHFYTVSLREQLKGTVKVIELVPPGVQTELTPGQSTRDPKVYMPLDAYISEAMALFAQQPTPDEIVVQRAQMQRLAEREGRFDQVFERINANAKAMSSGRP